MATTIGTVKACDCARSVTLDVNITGWRWWRVRQAIGLSLIRIGVWVCGIKGNVIFHGEEARK